MAIEVSQKLTVLQAFALGLVDTERVKAAAMQGGCLAKNLAFDTEDFTTIKWTKTGVTASKNQATSPRGDKTMNKLVEDSSTGVHQVITFHPAQSFSVTAFGQVAVSVHAKAGSRNWLLLGFQDAGGGGASAQAYFDLATGTVGSFEGSATTLVSKAIEHVGSGIYRCKLVFQRQSGTSGQMYVGMATGDLVSSYTGDGASDVFIWGAQAEDQAGIVRCYAREPIITTPLSDVPDDVYAKAVYNFAAALRDEDATRS